MEKDKSIYLDDQVCFALYAASREVIKLYKPLLDPYNLTYTQYVAMIVLWEEKKVTVKGIGKRLHLDSGTLTPLLKKLEVMGLIKRYRDENDDRVVIAELTEKGEALQKEIVGVPTQMACKIGVDREGLSILKKELDGLLECLSKN